MFSWHNLKSERFSKSTRRLLEEHKEWIVIGCTTPYLPELNLIETRWKVTKNAVTR